jgi:2-polyprenyl-3-methyl-5-hydroxy-6-metoxy-1,4-benzoquinol methylase
MSSAWKKLRQDPIGTVRRAWEKLVAGRLRYGRNGDYDASRYWKDRFSRHGTSLRGAGDEGLAQAENEREYAQAAQKFRQLVADVGIDFGIGSTLEIGCGPGFYTKLMAELGAREMVAYDITDVLFAELRAQLPTVEFRQGDVTAVPLQGTYDRAVMIDVLEHIVNEEKLASGLRNVVNALGPDARFVVGPVVSEDRGKRHLYYVRFWTAADLRTALPDWETERSVEFRDGDLLVLRRATAS